MSSVSRVKPLRSAKQKVRSTDSGREVSMRSLVYKKQTKRGLTLSRPLSKRGKTTPFLTMGKLRLTFSKHWVANWFSILPMRVVT